jgi:hypothetical protein
MKIIVIAACMMVLFFPVPLQAQTVTAAQKADIEKAVTEQVTQLYAAFDRLDAEAANQFWSRDKIIGSLTPTGLNSDLESMLKGTKNTFANRTVQKSVITDMKVLMPSPEMSIAFVKGTNRIEYKNGNVSLSNWASTTIWVKEPGGWKLAHMAQVAAAIQ